MRSRTFVNPVRSVATTLSLALLALAMPASAEVDVPALIKRAKPAIVTIVGYDAAGEPSQIGTGFFVDRRGYLVTNRHVLQGAVRAEVKGTSGRTYPIERVLAEDEWGDLIKVKVGIPITRVRVLRFARQLPETGERVIVIGSPFGLEQTVSDGIVSTVRDFDDVGKVLQITAPVSPGSSGSPVINAKGHVIGVATVQLAAGQNLNFALPSARVLEMKSEKTQSFSEWSGESHARAALTASAAGKWHQAIELYEAAAVLRPDSAEVANGLGVAYHALGKYREAFASYQHALSLNPSYAEAHYHVGELYGTAEQWDDAIAAYCEAIRQNEDYAEAHRKLSVAYSRTGNEDAAAKQVALLEKLDPDLAAAAAREIEDQ